VPKSEAHLGLAVGVDVVAFYVHEKTLWWMLYETAARANEVLALDVTDLDLGRAHLAEAGVQLPLLMAKSRHSSLTSLGIYARPTFDAVAAATAALDSQHRH
jgi:integrase